MGGKSSKKETPAVNTVAPRKTRSKKTHAPANVVPGGGFYEEYKLGEPIGEAGGYGQAFRCTEISTGIERAVKIIKLNGRTNFRKNRAALEMFKTEIQIMRRLQHPHLVHGIAKFEDPDNLFFVMELCEGGDLFERLAQRATERKHFSEAEASDLIRQMCLGLKELHDNQIMHCDLKPDNALFYIDGDGKSTLKICDFGMSRYVVDRKELFSRKVGTAYYMAPEVISGSYTYHCDMWSVGVITYILLLGFPPFNGREEDEICRQILRGFDPTVRSGRKGSFFPAAQPLSDEAMDFITNLLKTDHATRLSVDEALIHPWLNGTASTTHLQGWVESFSQFNSVNGLKRAVLEAMCDSFTDTELRHLEDTFRELDVNGDGFLTLEELKGGLQTDQVALFTDMIRACDMDGDGQLSYSELIMASVQRKLVAKEERIYNVFVQLDADRDGVLSPNEIKDILVGDEKDEVLAVLAECDVDGDGKLDYEEFLEVFMQKQQTRARSDGTRSRSGRGPD
jgi:calcium-dependent protein kinase